jgi:hypothetical protein
VPALFRRLRQDGEKIASIAAASYATPSKTDGYLETRTSASFTSPSIRLRVLANRFCTPALVLPRHNRKRVYLTSTHFILLKFDTSDEARAIAKVSDHAREPSVC